MFDELDDPAFAGAGDGAREAVAARATAIRRRRRAAWAGGGTSLAVVVATVLYATSGGSPRSLDVVSETPTPTAGPAEPTGSPEPSGPASSPPLVASPTSPGPSRTRGPSPSPSAEPTEEWLGWDRPDGTPGWSNGFGGCGQNTALPPAGTAPFADLTLELRLPSDTLRGGQTHLGTVVVTNTGTRYLRFAVSEHDTDVVLADGRGNLNGGPWSDAIAISRVELAPGESVERTVPIRTYVCGDTSADPETPLPRGSYIASAAIQWHSPGVGTAPEEPEPSPTGGGPALPTPTEEPSPAPSPSPSWGEPDNTRSGSWATPRVTVTVT